MGVLDQSGGCRVLTAATWVGGLVAAVVVVRSAHVSLTPTQRVRFFQALGQQVPHGPGWLFLHHGRYGDVVSARAAPVGGCDGGVGLGIAALALSAVVGVVQARAMTRLRRRAIDSPADRHLRNGVVKGARKAIIFRPVTAVLTLASAMLGVVVATG